VSEDRVKLFDEWSGTYDQSVTDYKGFPFEGYEAVLDAVAREARPMSGMSVLDIGIGTGRLAERFLKAGCSVWGLDFSVKMLARTRARFPQIELIKADLLGDWPIDKDSRFDGVVSGYVLHEFDLDSKIRLVTRLVRQHLVPGGRMVVGDISFETVARRDEARREWGGTWDEARQEWEGSLWDEDEHYWAADEARSAFESAGLEVSYEQVSFCGGVYVITPAAEL
jgi:putative AdoMet-dependent methyltransferase